VLGEAFVVTARSGRRRLTLLVTCPYCSQMHEHKAPVGFDLARRGAGCGYGKYVVVALAVTEAGVA
jgi:hypothetical protein